MSNETVELRVGTLGLRVACDLFGYDIVEDVGCWLTPARIRIPKQDEVAFLQLLAEETNRFEKQFADQANARTRKVALGLTA